MSERDGNIPVLNFHYLAGTPQVVSYFTGQHRPVLFTHEEYIEAFRHAGLDASRNREGLMGRDLYLGTRPLEV